MRTIKKYFAVNLDSLRPKILNWAQQFEEIIWLDGNDYALKEKSFEAILAVDAFTALRTDSHNGFEKLKEYQNNSQDWIFGYLTYDLKNDVENLQSNNVDGLNFPDLYFFQPKKIFLVFDHHIELQYLNFVADEMDRDWESILAMDLEFPQDAENDIDIRPRTSKEEYVLKVKKAIEHIKQGNIYEVNICQEFFADNSVIEPLSSFLHLNEISKAPFSVFLKLNEIFALSASPERYIKRNGNRVVSQPIKGTAKRLRDTEEDLKLAEFLMNDPKERSENIMITDLVRNDLSKFAEMGSVNVDELCGLYSFEQVHQLISTISCRVSMDEKSVDIVKNTFPMGSMTGAPKVSAMKIIEELEDAKRGLYSGSVGYFKPDGDFDFNVIIRSILYNSDKRYVSYSVGGAITINSVPESEYDECLLKAAAMNKVLTLAH